jgi:hypothetical protein
MLSGYNGYNPFYGKKRERKWLKGSSSVIIISILMCDPVFQKRQNNLSLAAYN